MPVGSQGWAEPASPRDTTATVFLARREPSGGDGWRWRTASLVVRPALGVLKGRDLVLSSSSSSSLSPRPPTFSLVPLYPGCDSSQALTTSPASSVGQPDASSREFPPPCPHGCPAAPAPAGGGGSRAEPAARGYAAPRGLPQPAEPQPVGGRAEHLRAGVPGRPGERGTGGLWGRGRGWRAPSSPPGRCFGVGGPMPSATAGQLSRSDGLSLVAAPAPEPLLLPRVRGALGPLSGPPTGKETACCAPPRPAPRVPPRSSHALWPGDCTPCTPGCCDPAEGLRQGERVHWDGASPWGSGQLCPVIFPPPTPSPLFPEGRSPPVDWAAHPGEPQPWAPER